MCVCVYIYIYIYVQQQINESKKVQAKIESDGKMEQKSYDKYACRPYN